MKNCLSILGALVLSLSAFNASADGVQRHFSYRVEIPITKSDCGTRTSQITALFQAYGVTVESANCQSTRVITEDNASYTIGTVIVTYSASESVHPYRAVFSGSGFQGDAYTTRGLFDSLGGCLNFASTEVPRFESETKLAALAVECVPGEYDQTQYSLRISALGKPARKLYVYARQLTSTGDDLPPEIQRAAANVLTTLGADISQVVAGHTFYYFDRPVTISNPQMGSFAKGEECRMQLAEAQKILTANLFVAPQAFCTGDLDGSSATLEGIGGDVILLNSDNGLSENTYSTFRECYADKERVIANEQAYGAKVLGLICHPKLGRKDAYVAEIYKPSM